ncbi:L,D-transpeptidase family protein [Blastomonas sp.]|uniref:L,D-transpeptidase family protein n=1 Tax=Blastomonas sp. TaxID=1909299 RepID=UPI00261841A8|nr:L,D-transpeptidase family protein [Blastomonas sp.]MDM7955738.1 L,D-transpeptidase family protein [Blastomonas sp.]
MKAVTILAALIVLGACNSAPEDAPAREAKSQAAPTGSPTDFVEATEAAPYAETPVLRAQVILDHLGFSPGVIDGEEGQSYRAALRGFQAANDLADTGQLDEATLAKLGEGRATAATRVVIIPEQFAAGPFIPDFPADAADQAKLPRLGYRNLLEALAERFHTTPEAITAMNPGVATLAAGTAVRVPNIPNADSTIPGDDPRGWSATLASLGVAAQQPKADRVVVDESEGVLKVFSADDRLIAQFPATMGSSRDPLPIGEWKILGVSRNPDFRYNPKLFWDVSNDKDAQLLNPGPNSPVGVAWIDLNKPHYGIHGTSEPHTIGRAESHGCIRLTNWDAARLAQMVQTGTAVTLQK